MMTNKYVCKLKPYIQPFEKVLAIKELCKIADSTPIVTNTTENSDLKYSIETHLLQKNLLERLTYWESIQLDGLNHNNNFTLQVKREATTNVVRNGIALEDIKRVLPFKEDIPLHNRRNLRYGTHGIHEYRGKFFPQLVKSLLNISGATKKSNILDAMCGSGTTLVESNLIGATAYGIDQNPLSVFISKTKCELLKVKPDELSEGYSFFRARLLELTNPIKHENIWITKLSLHDQQYLKEWFSPEVINQLDQIMVNILKVENIAFQNLFKVSLSNILRSISWQKDDDLRVRKEIRNDIEIDVISEYLTELGRSVRIILAFLYENEGHIIGNTNIIEGDARHADQLLKSMGNKIDVNITSPPYATALPYLDTDRLSLYYLGFLKRSYHREKDYLMIGNREVTNGLKKEYWQKYNMIKRELPTDIVSVIDLIHNLNDNPKAGFRRKNLSYLLAHYFMDMGQVFESQKKLLKKGAYSFFVVGNNHTVANGERVDIKTDELLAQLGQSKGFKLEEIIPMEILLSRDIFKKNASNTEKILVFRNS